MPERESNHTSEEEFIKMSTPEASSSQGPRSINNRQFPLRILKWVLALLYNVIKLILRPIGFIILLFVMPNDLSNHDDLDVLRENKPGVLHWIIDWWMEFTPPIMLPLLCIVRPPKEDLTIYVYFVLGYFAYFLLVRFMHLLITGLSYYDVYKRVMLTFILREDEVNWYDLYLRHRRTECLVITEMKRKVLPLFSYFDGFFEPFTWFGYRVIRKKWEHMRAEGSQNQCCRKIMNEAICYIHDTMEKEFGTGTPYAGQYTVSRGLQKHLRRITEWFNLKTKVCGGSPKSFVQDIETACQEMEKEFITLDATKACFRSKATESSSAKDHEEHVHLLKTCATDLVRSLELDPMFIATLQSKGSVPDLFLEKLKIKEIPRSERVEMLISKLQQYPRASFEGFLMALIQSQQSHLALLMIYQGSKI